MTNPLRSFPAPPPAVLFGAGGLAFALAVLWLAGIGRPHPPSRWPGWRRDLAAVEARTLPDVGPALALAEAARTAAEQAQRGLAEAARQAAMAQQAAEQQAAALDRRLVALEARLQAEDRRIAALEEAARRPAADPALLAALAARLDRLAEAAAAREAREAEQERAREVLTRALEARIAAAEGSIGHRAAALEAATGQRLAAAETALASRAAAIERALSERLSALEARERRISEAEARLARLVALGLARLALEEGGRSARRWRGWPIRRRRWPACRHPATDGGRPAPGLRRGRPRCPSGGGGAPRRRCARGGGAADRRAGHHPPRRRRWCSATPPKPFWPRRGGRWRPGISPVLLPACPACRKGPVRRWPPGSPRPRPSSLPAPPWLVWPAADRCWRRFPS